MKRSFAVILAIILISSLALAACSSPTSPQPQTQAPAPTQAQSTSQPSSPAATSAPPQPSSPAPANAKNLKFSYHTPPKAGLVPDFFIPWTKDIENASNGTITITHYGGATLVPLENQYEAVRSGLADMAMVETDVTPGRFPLSEIGLLPLVFPNAEIGARVYHELLAKYTYETELKDVKVLVTPALTPMQYYGNKQVHELKDLQGMKMRTGGKVEAWITEALGATPVEFSTNDLYSSLERNLVDGCWFNTAGVMGFALQEVTKHRTIVNLFPRIWVIVINRQVYNSLPPEAKAAFDMNSTPEISSKYSAVYEKSSAGAQKAIEGYDAKVGNPPFYVLPDDEKARWIEAVKPVWDKWIAEVEAKGLPGRQMLDDALKLVQEYSAK